MNGRAHPLPARVGVPAPGGDHVLRRPLIIEVPFGREALLALESDLTPSIRAGADADAAPVRDRGQDARVCRRRLSQAERGRAVCGPSLRGNGPERAWAANGVSTLRSNRHEQEDGEPGNGSAPRRTNHGATLRRGRGKVKRTRTRTERSPEPGTWNSPPAPKPGYCEGSVVGEADRGVEERFGLPRMRKPHPCLPTCHAFRMRRGSIRLYRPCGSAVAQEEFRPRERPALGLNAGASPGPPRETRLVPPPGKTGSRAGRCPRQSQSGS